MAFGWGLALLVLACTVRLEGETSSSTTVSQSGQVVAHSTDIARETLVHQWGTWTVVPIGLPALIALFVGVALRRRRRGAASGGVLPELLIGLLGVFALLGILTVGVFLLPVVILLALAAGLTPSSPLGRGGAQPSSAAI